MTVETLQNSLQAKAKSDPGYRFYSLWDKVYRIDILIEAYERCRTNGGAAGIDRVEFGTIEDHGVSRWLDHLAQELRIGMYHPQPLRRVWIPKSNGGQRPLGIPTIRDRVVQMAVHLVLSPIFEADLIPEQYGFRPGVDAKMAVRRVHFHIRAGHTEIVDGDLRDYFNTIPHGALMKCVARRVADGRVLSVIKGWLNVPVHRADRPWGTSDDHGTRRTQRDPSGRRYLAAAGEPLLPPLCLGVADDPAEHGRKGGSALSRVGQLPPPEVKGMAAAARDRLAATAPAP